MLFHELYSHHKKYSSCILSIRAAQRSSSLVNNVILTPKRRWTNGQSTCFSDAMPWSMRWDFPWVNAENFEYFIYGGYTLLNKNSLRVDVPYFEYEYSKTHSTQPLGGVASPSFTDSWFLQCGNLISCLYLQLSRLFLMFSRPMTFIPVTSDFLSAK